MPAAAVPSAQFLDLGCPQHQGGAVDIAALLPVPSCAMPQPGVQPTSVLTRAVPSMLCNCSSIRVSTTCTFVCAQVAVSLRGPADKSRWLIGLRSVFIHSGAVGASMPRGPPILEGHEMLAFMRDRHNILPLKDLQACYACLMQLGAGGFGTVTR